MNNNELQCENQSAAGRWTATPEPGATPATGSVPDGVPEGMPDGIPKAAVVAWAAGPKAAPSGRKGKKMRRRTRKIAAALAVIFVMSTTGTPAALAQNSFYKASPYVENEELVDAGAKSFDERLAIGEPETTPSAPVAATDLEDAILSGGLSPGKMEMPDMMLAGISGDEMALAAAADDSYPASDTAAQPSKTDQAGQTPNGAPKGAGGGGGDAGGGSTVGDLAKNAADENPDGYASPALGGDPEPIVDEYAQAEGGLGDEPDADQTPATQTPTNVELAEADTGIDSGADTGTGMGADTGVEAPTDPTVSDDGSQPGVGGESDKGQPQSDELAVIPPSALDEGGSEEESTQTPTDQSVPTGTTPEQPPTEEPSTEEPSEAEGSSPADQVLAGEPEGEAEQAFADPLATEKDDEATPSDEQSTDQPYTADPTSAEPSSEGGSEEDGGSSELAATPSTTPSEDNPVPDPVPEDIEPIEDSDPSTVPAAAPPDEALADQTSSEGGSDGAGYEEGANPEQVTNPEEGTNPKEQGPGEDLAGSTASINQSSSVQVFADEGSSAEVDAVQVAAINDEGELDRDSLSDPSGQSEDAGPKPETNGELGAADKGAGDEEKASAEPKDKEDALGAEDQALPDEGQQAEPGAQGDPQDVSRPTDETTQPVDENGQNYDTRPPTETEPKGKPEPELTGTEPTAPEPIAEEPDRNPQATDKEGQQSVPPQNTTPQTGDPQEEPSNAGTTGAEDSSLQDAPAQVAPTPTQSGDRQPEKRQSGPARQLDGSGSAGPDNPRGQQPDVRQDSTGRAQPAPGAKPAPATQRSPRATESPNVRKPALPSRGGRERSKPEVTHPDSSTGVPARTGKQGIQRAEEQVGNVVEEQSFTPDPAAGEIGESEPTTPADPLLDGSTAGIESEPSPAAADGVGWTNQPAVLASQQAEVATQTYVEPTVEPITEPAAEQALEQPVQQTGVGGYAEPSAIPDQASVSQDTYESVEGVAQEAANPYVDEESIGTEIAADPNTYNNDPYPANETSESYEDPVAAPVSSTSTAPAVEETYAAQNTATLGTNPGYVAQDAGTYGEVQEAAPVASAPTYEETYQEVSAQVPAQELAPAPQVTSQTLEPAPQVTNTLAGESSAAPSAAPSGGTSGAASPATGVGKAQPSVDTVAQNTTSNVTSGGQK